MSHGTKQPESLSSASLAATLTLPSTTSPLLDLLELRQLFYPTLQHPIEALQAYFPQDYLPTMFGGKRLTPETDIPNLSGKVYLVTGGWTSRSFGAAHISGNPNL